MSCLFHPGNGAVPDCWDVAIACCLNSSCPGVNMFLYFFEGGLRVVGRDYCG